MDLGAVISSNPSILKAFSNLREEPSPDLPVIQVKVKLTWRCNLSCIFCSLPEPRLAMTREMALSLGRELSSQGLKKVHFSGGEILTHPECYAILSDWAGLGIQVNLTSNGSLMGKEEIKRLEEAGVHSISLSIDSSDRKVHDRLRGMKGCHKAVIRAAERIVSRGRIKLRINTVATSLNITGLPGLLPAPRVLGKIAAAIRDWPELEDTAPFGTTAEELRQVSAGRHGFRQAMCYVPWFHLFFSPDGACHPCCMARGRTSPLGTYPVNTVRDIASGTHMRAFRSLLASGAGHEACTYCDDFLKENRIISRLIPDRKDSA